MIENNDSRYAFKWLKDDYMDNTTGQTNQAQA